MHYQQATFLLSAASTKQLPPDDGIEVAFVGRSNAGKSSALNTLTQQRGLAKTSKTPGRTRLINVFSLTEQARLIDLPGYGYAKATQTEQAKWKLLVGSYLNSRHSLKGLVLLSDCRHPLKPLDCQMIDWAYACELPIHIVLTKADKLKRGAQQAALLAVKQSLIRKKMTDISAQLFSATSRQGLDELKEQVDAWFENEAFNHFV